MAKSPFLSGNAGSMESAALDASDVPGVYAEIEITKWTYKGEVDSDRFATNKSAPNKRSIPGNKSGTGTAEGRRTTDATRIENVLSEGDVLSLKLLFDKGGPTGIVGDCLIKDLQFDVDIDGGGAESFVFNFETDGAMVPV
jgi:hypothetical protein